MDERDCNRDAVDCGGGAETTGGCVEDVDGDGTSDDSTPLLLRAASKSVGLLEGAAAILLCILLSWL